MAACVPTSWSRDKRGRDGNRAKSAASHTSGSVRSIPSGTVHRFFPGFEVQLRSRGERSLVLLEAPALGFVVFLLYVAQTQPPLVACFVYAFGMAASENISRSVVCFLSATVTTSTCGLGVAHLRTQTARLWAALKRLLSSAMPPNVLPARAPAAFLPQRPIRQHRPNPGTSKVARLRLCRIRSLLQLRFR